MDVKKLKTLLRKEEGLKLDFKLKIDLESESGKKEFAKDVCALANSRGGRGYLIIGVQDKSKNIIGIDDMKISEEQVQQIVSSRCEPPVPVSLDILSFENKEIAVITIYDSQQKPFQIKESGAFYIRRGSTTDTMRKQELISSFEENFALNLETCPIYKSSLSILDLSLIDRYFILKGIEVNDDNRLDLMESAAIVVKDKEDDEFVPTIGGLLIFSRTNNIYLPHNMIRIVNKINKNLDEISIVIGDLVTMLDESEKLLNKILPAFYPIDAVFEGIKNAVLYRDYSVYFKEIEVIIDFNSISIISPGTILKDFSDNNIRNHNYLKRNMWIYEKLITIDEKKRFLKSGRGFGKMKKAFINHGKVIFVNSYEKNHFKVIFPGVNKF